MSYLDQINRCNEFTREGYVPFELDGQLIGWPNKKFIEYLREFDFVFDMAVIEEKLQFVSSLDTADKRTHAMTQVANQLHESGVIRSWVGEQYAITNNFGDVPFFTLERAAVAFFGLRSYGVHLNGLVKKSDGIYIWIARRTKAKPFWPGKLDQMVAGGQPAGISLLENMVKESQEEANIPESLAKNVSLVSELHYLGKSTLGKSIDQSTQDLMGMNSDTLFNYDLWLPEDFVPENTDGEVDEFMLMSIEEMAHLTDITDEFKNNCTLVNIDLLIRLGIITAEHPDFDEIKRYLYQAATLEPV